MSKISLRLCSNSHAKNIYIYVPYKDIEAHKGVSESQKSGNPSKQLTNLITSPNTNLNLKGSIQEIHATENSNNSSNSTDSSQMNNELNDDNKKELDNRLEEFIRCFLEEFEEKITIAYLILKGKITKPGKFADKFSGIGGQVVGGIIGGLVSFLIGFQIVPLIASSTKSCVEKIASNLGNKCHQIKDINLRSLINLFKTDRRSFRTTLVKIAYDIFQSFELQCMRITTDQGPEKAMELLARDATNRAINYCVKNNSCSVREGVIFGDSKIEPILGIPMYSSKLKTPGFEITYQYNALTKKWHTASLFEKVGIIRHETISKKVKQYFQKVDGTSKIVKYGCRRLLSSESWDELKDKYELVIDKNEHFQNYDYILDSDDSESKTRHILDRINQDDVNLLGDRLKEVLRDIEQSIVDHLMDTNVALDEHSKILENIIIILNDIRESPSDYLRKFEQELEEIRKVMSDSHREIKDNVNQISQKQDIYHDGNTREHEKTQDLVRKLLPQDTESDECFLFMRRTTVIYFIGRTTEIEYLQKVLQNENGSVVISQVTSITGLGGIGKTELARRYALTHFDYYKNIIWLNAETNESLLVDIMKLAYKLEIDTNGREIDDIFDDIYKKLTTRGKSLFIFDNVEEYKDIKSYLFRISFCIKSIHVIITSRNQKWEAGDKGRIKVIKLNSFTPDEATNFVKNFLKLEDNSQDDDVKQLIEELQYFPLALRQAVVYIEQVNQTLKRRGKGKFTVGNYLETWKQHQSKLLDQGYYEDCVYTKTVLTTWTTTMEKIKVNGENGKLAIDLLNIMAYFPPNKIPIEVMFSILVNDNEKLWNAIELLDQYSMIDLEDGKANIHRLVQQVTRFELEKQDNYKDVIEKIIVIFKTALLDENILDKLVMYGPHFILNVDSIFSSFINRKPEETELGEIGMAISRELAEATKKAFGRLMLKQCLPALSIFTSLIGLFWGIKNT